MAHILVVDDEYLICNLIKEVLAVDGHTVDTAGDGAEAVAAARKKQYDLVIMDRNMPRTDGIAALTVMRHDSKLKNLKVIMCTSSSVTKELDEAFRAGAKGYILKPINLDALLTKVHSMLGQH
jgi:CheY-like chemotaxis protein